MSALGTMPASLVSDEEDLPSFGQWIRKKSATLTLPVLIAALNLGLNVASKIGGKNTPDFFLTEQLFKSHILQAVLLVVLLLLVPKSFRSKNAEHMPAMNAAEDFRTAWLLTLLAWLGLYVIFVIESMPGIRNTAWVQSPLMHIVEGLVSCLSTLGFWKCFLTVSNPDEKGDPMKWLAIILFLVGMDGVARFTHSEGFDLLINLSIGALSGTALAFFVGRLESRLLRPPRWLLMALYTYAVMQFAYGFLEFKSPIDWKPAFFISLLILKILLALFVNWLVGTGNLLFYLRFMSSLNHNYDERRRVFLQELGQ